MHVISSVNKKHPSCGETDYHEGKDDGDAGKKISTRTRTKVASLHRNEIQGKAKVDL